MKATSAIYASLSLASLFTLSSAGAASGSGSVAAQHRNLRLARSEPIPARRAMGRRTLGRRTDHLSEPAPAGGEASASYGGSESAAAATSVPVVQHNVVTSINSKGQTVVMTYPASDSPAPAASHLVTSAAAAEAPAGKHLVTSVNSQGQTITMTMDGPAPVATPKTKEAPDLCKTGSAETDLLVLNFANTLEKLETQFYIQGLAKFSQSDMVKTGLSNEQAQIIIETLSVIAGDENEHSIALEATIKALGSTPFNGCSFDFSAALSSPAVFLATARALELVGVSAYAGGAALITSRSLLTAATGIHSIEARHQTTLNILNAGSVIPSAFDIALTPPAVLALAGGFLSGCSAEDFGLTAGNPLSVRNAWTKSTKFAPGDQLSFTSVIEADENNVFCAMLVGGASQTVTLPLHQCIIPDHVDGPVYVWITSDSTPLAADINIRDGSSILAGPGLFFVEGSSSLLQNAFTFTDKTAAAGQYEQKGKKAMAGADLGYAGVCKMGDLNKSGKWYEKPENQMQIEQTDGIGCKVLGFKTVTKDALPK